MIVRNWMQPEPLTIPSSTLVSEAKRLCAENHLHALPVVDDGKLRGLVTRVNLLRMGQLVLATQNPDEFNFFVTRLRVRDVMVRRPATLHPGDTIEHCLRKGQQLGVAQFPVLEGERVVGVISANEIFQIAGQCVGVSDGCAGITVGPVRLGPGVMGRIAAAAEQAGAVLQAMSPVAFRGDAISGGAADARKIQLRLGGADVHEVAAALEAAGFAVIGCTEPTTSPMAA
ncbi:MAG TPA: CBS domain-containing protein [Rubrivivax sp.]|jgi:acetoin utilization protein AcuB|nr:CBS domain-containing protein [Pseudomonadota bacterium]HPP83734.1 CBS domain-containing protein [Rubrivivax sp.]